MQPGMGKPEMDIELEENDNLVTQPKKETKTFIAQLRLLIQLTARKVNVMGGRRKDL
jgi:hypothetical protein